MTYDPQHWAVEFVTQLLTTSFARESRTQLAGWLSAEEAPELLPGVPPDAADKVLNLSLLDPAMSGTATSPIPSPDQWTTLAWHDVSWSVGPLLVQPDPKWSEIVADGWEPIDQRFQALDVSGQLIIREGPQTSQHRFALVIYVGSAHWHPGYGTVAVSNWTVS